MPTTNKKNAQLQSRNWTHATDRPSVRPCIPVTAIMLSRRFSSVAYATLKRVCVCVCALCSCMSHRAALMVTITTITIVISIISTIIIVSVQESGKRTQSIGVSVGSNPGGRWFWEKRSEHTSTHTHTHTHKSSSSLVSIYFMQPCNLVANTSTAARKPRSSISLVGSG